MPTHQQIEGYIAQTAQGDRAAFRALYDATSGRLFGVLVGLLKDHALAEDALQDVYVKIWRHARVYRQNGLSPMTWLIAIARNHAIDRLRRARSRDTDAPEPRDMSDLGAIPDPAPCAEGHAVARSELARLNRCLDTLGTPVSQILRGAYLNGDSYAELAARFDVPLNTLRTWLRRGLQSLRECLST